ncbi:hypothetical protein PSEUBRA_004060 [Kalmanozyma brasiliensis GHG001]|uniref:Uncharacterized protein n=1 Tax=Kalmanozyma brasiliensis (strain GHG001) TaxID=1365824 RepID=V5E7C9_KALBG|nr:uncharacterized protein PSEUBRA_004060 [Kalmanozyma brasiliensis GHG001]EST06181.1 hypothetical protein PSEUBRA_004060 [Kalmanozyma brasiliensis GHG001]
MSSSRLSRQDHYPYQATAHPRWSPSSPPLNRLSAAVDPRLAPRLNNAGQQDMQQQSQTQQLASSQIAPSAASLTSNVEVVQAINAMNSQVTSQLSMMGTQLASLVSLTSRLIELSQMSLAAADSNGRASNAATAPGSGVSAASLGAQGFRADASPVNSNADLNRARVNGSQNTSSFASSSNNLAVGSTNNAAARSDARQGQFYQNPASGSAATNSTLDRTFGSTLRGASPSSSNSVMNNSLYAAAGRPAQQQAGQAQQMQSQQQSQTHMQSQQQGLQQTTQPQQQAQDDLLRSRLPSPVFPDDPMDMHADVSASEHQTPSNLKRLSTAGQAAGDSARKASTEASLGEWKSWLNRTWQPPAGHQSRNTKYRTMQAARRAHRDQTKRSMATLGRLPLKEFLEIRPEQYLSVRKTGRKLYQEWLLQEVRLAKQPEDRVKAAINRLENDHPELGDCEDHWKARQLLQQIIDNAIDEANLHRKKEARQSNSHAEPNESTPRGMEGARSTSMMNVSASSSSSALADADRSLRGADTSIASARKGNTAAANGPGAAKNAKGVQRRKADQAELDDTPTRFRQPPSQRNSMLGPGGNDDSSGSSLQTQQLSSSGLEAAHSGRATALVDYSGYGNHDSGTIASTTSDALQPSRHNQHLQPAHHNTHQQDQTHNAWASQTAAPGPSLFGQSNYTTTATQQALSHHQTYGHHSNHHHNSNYLSSDPNQTGLSASGSGLLDDQRHQSHLSPLVNGGNLRMHQQQQHHQQQPQQQAQSTFFDNRGYQ